MEGKRTPGATLHFLSITEMTCSRQPRPSLARVTVGQLTPGRRGGGGASLASLQWTRPPPDL